MRILLACKEMIAFERAAIMALSSTLKRDGHEVKAVVIKSAEPLTSMKMVKDKVGKEGLENPDGVFKIVSNFQPQVIGYSVMTGEHYDILDLNRRLKNSFNFISVMGGPHPTFNNQVIEEDGIDAICTGEGDNSFPEFIRRIESGEDYWLTETFHTKHNQKIYRNPLGKLISDLNELPFPDRQVLYDADPNLANIGNKSFITARGCPFKCTYCFNNQYNDNYKGLGQILRTRSPELVIEEIERVKDDFPLDNVTFNDDIFILRPNGWIKKFAKLYKRKIGLPFNITARPSVVKKEDIKTLKDCGLTYVWLGIECGDEEIANKVFMRTTSNETILKVAKWFHENNVKIIALNIMGLPVDNPFEVDLRTIDLNLKIKPALFSCGLLYPFPGTAIAKIAIESGHFTEDDNTVYLESNKHSSMLTFKSEKEKMMVENAQKLGGIVVEFPFLRPFVRFLCSLPLTNFYHLLFYIHLGYCHKIRLNPPKIRNITKELPVFWSYFRTLLRKT
jgi:radical SAM superfamily enzyme YgiQ (UPF0313 family)